MRFAQSAGGEIFGKTALNTMEKYQGQGYLKEYASSPCFPQRCLQLWVKFWGFIAITFTVPLRTDENGLASWRDAAS